MRAQWRRLRLGATLAGAAAVAASTTLPATALGEPTVWARARDPDVAESRDLAARAEAILIRYRKALRGGSDGGSAMGVFHLREARPLLEAAVAKNPGDAATQLRLADLLHELREFGPAARSFETLLRGSPPAPIAAEAWRQVAVCYARLGRHDDELVAYREALALEPHASSRALLLANRAEAFMALGRIAEAVEGYESALASLSSMEMFRYGATTLWGLAVALDRSGDLDGALAKIELARAYDPVDRMIHGPSWFYVPAHDESWYAALGHLAAARVTELGAVRAESYARAVAALEDYIRRAPPEDPWSALAHARLRALRAEAERAARRTLRFTTGAGR